VYPLAKILEGKQKTFLAVISVVFFGFLSPGQSAVEKPGPAGPSIVPRPAKMEVGAGYFQIGPKTSIVLDSRTAETAQVGEFLAAKLGRPTGYSLDIRPAAGQVPANVILLRTGDRLSRLGNEGYQLSVSRSGVKIEAAAPAGLFYGVQTLLQLLPAEVEGSGKADGVTWKIPFVKIEDRPRFVWRGVHLDVGRHFFPKEFIKKYIDLLAMY